MSMLGFSFYKVDISENFGFKGGDFCFSLMDITAVFSAIYFPCFIYGSRRKLFRSSNLMLFQLAFDWVYMSKDTQN